MNFRRVILPLIPHLQSAPLVWLLALYYRLAVTASVRAVRGVPGVRAVYLSGSLARGEAVYGMSDIDLKVIVAGGDDQAVVRRIRERLRRLAVAFPILGSYREKGVFFEETLAERIGRYPLLRHLFDRDFYPDRLVWGEDVLTRRPLPTASEEERLLSYLWKAKYWLEKIFVFAEEPRLGSSQRLYLMAKAVGNCGQMLARIDRPGGAAVGLTEGFGVLSAGLDPRSRSVLDRLLVDRRRLFRGSTLGVSDVFPVFMESVGALVRAIARELATDTAEPSAPTARITGEGWRPAEEVEAAWRETVAACCPQDCTVELLPPVLLGVSVLDCDEVVRPLLLIRSPRRLAFETLLGLRSTWETSFEGQAQVIVRDNPDFVYAVHTDMLEHWLDTGMENQLLVRTADGSDLPLGRFFVDLTRRRLEEQLGEILELAAGRATATLAETRLDGVLRLCLRNLALLSSIRVGEFELAVGPGPAARRLERDGRLPSALASRSMARRCSTGVTGRSCLWGRALPGGLC